MPTSPINFPPYPLSFSMQRFPLTLIRHQWNNIENWLIKIYHYLKCMALCIAWNTERIRLCYCPLSLVGLGWEERESLNWITTKMTMIQNNKWKSSRKVQTKYYWTLKERNIKLGWEDQEWLLVWLETNNKKRHYYYLHSIGDTSLGTTSGHL